MWTAEEFTRILERHPNGGTFWTRTHRMVRYIRVFRRKGKGIVVAVMTEKWGWRGGGSNKVELFVQTPMGVKVAEFPEAKNSSEFLESLLSSPILDLVAMSSLPSIKDVKEFIATPDKTYLITW